VDQSLEIFEERAAIREYDGLMTREEAERLAKLDSVEWMQACEVRWMMKMTLHERRSYLEEVKKKRGEAGEKELKDRFLKAWKKT
jgi:hypothetical protein